MAAEIMSGRLTMRPHGAWQLPETILWDEDPFAQRNWVFQFHTLRWMEPVRRIALAGDPNARKFWVDTCQSWIAANPPGASKSRYAWGDMVDGIRAMVMTLALPMFEGEDHEWLTRSIWEHGEWLADPSHLGHSNHALHQHQALLVVGRVFKYQPWVDLAIERLMELFDESFDDEGVNAEGSIAYHRLNHDWWETAFTRLDVEGIARPKNADRLKLALTELAYATKPNGLFERIGDIDVGGPTGLQSPELTYVQTQGASGQTPSDLTKVYKAGYVFGRSGWGDFEREFVNETFYSISYGPANRVHGHQDGASVTLHAEGSPWLVDAGKYAYVQDKMRDYCVRRLGHNVVHIDGVKYDPTSRVSLDRYKLTQEADDFVLSDNGYAGVKLTRRIIYVRGGDFFIVFDTVRSSKSITAHQRWHLDYETTVEPTKKGYNLNRVRGRASIQWAGKMPTLSTVRGQEDPLDGWMATDWMKREEATVLSATRSGDRFRFITVFGAGRRWERGPEVLSTSPQDADMVMTVRNGKTVWSVRIGRDTVEVAAGDGVFTAPRISNPLGLAAELVRDALSGESNVAPCTESAFSPAYWQTLRDWVRADDANQRLRRLMVLDRLLEKLDVAGDVTKPDNGLRSAIVDTAGHDLVFDGLISQTTLGVRREPLISWNQDVPVRSQTYGAKVHSIYGGISGRLPADSPATLSIEVGGLTLPVSIGRGDTDLLSVRFHGAINREKYTLPLFQGLTSESRGGNSFAIFQDPSLDLDQQINLAWFLGTKEVNLHQEIADVVREFARTLGGKRVVLSGSSGGGFTALQVASYLPDASVLAFNPQTIVGAYHRARAEPALAACFGGMEEAVSDPGLLSRISAVERYRGLGKYPSVLYVQNSGDGHHVQKHLTPFKDVIDAHPDAGRVEFIDVNWGKGHVSPTTQIYNDFLELAGARALSLEV
ncbi:heparinase II/III domain-containing protein [Arthrobacter caoxuetaonis]|uniref:Heparinase II/III family protein n=1 Tax=Arthrobacter caoxuetaonis TaxID=2886935 RepID=A0A9X1SC03_9MICC|nr:heparinase II/III family protein [Arthrobacter caoxuetaonis]MCC3297613.1 heparinase II/III family protein [Arthrobacter caoxuetaonis]USQ56179.1 heparinase II/III family protein [Arthrobacter caoxuetaonis]